MKKYIVLTLLILSAATIKSQVTISYSAGYGDYNMSKMKDLLQDRLSLISPQIDARIVDKFPGYVTHTIDVTFDDLKEGHQVGLKFSYLTTGGKTHYSDYSGQYYEKLTLNGYRIAGLYRYTFASLPALKTCKLSFFGELSPGLIFSKLDYEGLMGEEHIKDNLSSNMTGFTILPQVGANLRLPYGIGIHLTGGYDFEFGSKTVTKERANWSGIRLNGGVSYSF